MALPHQYLTDQPDLESHSTTYYERAENFQVQVVDQIQSFLNGSKPMEESSLDKLETDWINTLKRLTHSKDELNDKHLYRPLQVFIE